MHAPQPFGLHSYGEPLTPDDMAAVRKLGLRATNLRGVWGQRDMVLTRALPDGGSVTVLQAGGVFRCITHKPPKKSGEEESSTTDKGGVPMLFSALIADPSPGDGEGVALKLTRQCRRRLKGYSGEMAPEEVRLQRFRVEYDMRFREFVPENPGRWFFSQYTQLRATWYSGAMAEVVQIVGGYGRQDFDQLPQDHIEQARLVFPKTDPQQGAPQGEAANVILPGYAGCIPASGQIQYDYKHHCTHGVAFGEDGTPWLVCVNNRGVWVMPLPVIPATATAAFRAQVQAVEDDELLAILDRFGAFPSGEAMPEGEDFEAWRRAGVIIKACETTDFYAHMAYSTACGWSFNRNGQAAFNTCYDFDDDGLAWGFAFSLRLNIGAVPYDGRLPVFTHLAGDDGRRMSEYFARIYRHLSDDARSQAVKYKLRCAPPEQVLGRIDNTDEEAEVRYWQNVEMPPIASVSGSVRETYRGKLFHPAVFDRQPQIKFPEPIMGGCISFDFTPIGGIAGHTKTRCDTIMFGYYVGDTLKVVKYFYDPREFQREEDTDYENCMTVGAWFRTEYLSKTGLSGNFYTTDFDERQEVTGQVRDTRIVGEDAGFDSKPFFAFQSIGHKTGTLWRNRYYTHQTTTTQTDSRALSVGICVPYYCRNAILHAVDDRKAQGYGSESLKRYSVRDPTSYRYWTFHQDHAWIGNLPVQKGTPTPKDGNPVWVEMEEYKSAACSDFADYGSWIHGLPADYGWLIHPKANEWNQSGGGGAPPVNEYSRTTPPQIKEIGKLDIDLMNVPAEVHKDVPAGWYFAGSPSQTGDVFYRDACRVMFGEAQYGNVMEDAADGKRRRFGRTVLASHKSAHNFIGVINE